MARLKTQAELDLERIEQVQKLTGQYPIPTDRRALLYSRYSSAKQVVASISKGLEQSDGLIRRALDIGWKREDTTLFIENSMTKNGRIKSVSGTIPIEDRAGLSTVIEHVKLGAGAILCDDISRLTRDADLVDAATLARTCKQHDCIIVTNERIFNFKRQADYDAYIAEAQAAAAYLELHIKGKMLRNRTRKAEQGKVACGIAAVGLMLDDTGNHYIPSPHRSGVDWLYKRFMELEAQPNNLLRECNTMARQGKPLFPVHPDIEPRSMFLKKVYDSDGVLLGWTIGSRNGLTDLLTNPVYIGHLVFNGKIVQKNAHEAIVDENVWSYAFNHLSNTDLEGRPIDRPNRTVRYSYPESVQTALLAGTRDDGRPVIDGVDGMHVHVKQNTNMYILQNSRDTGMSMYETGIKVPYLDGIIETELLGMLKASEFAAEHHELRSNHDLVPDWHTEMVDFDQAIQDRKPQTTPQDDTLETLDAEIAQIKLDLEYASGVMDMQTRIEKYEKLARLNQRRDRLVQAEADRARTQERLEKARRQVKTAKDRWKSWDLEEKRIFIHVVTDSITFEEIASGWLKISVQWSDVLGGVLYGLYIWRPSGIQWSKDEEVLLKSHYPRAKRQDLLNKLPSRSWRGIGAKAQQLGVRRVAQRDVPNIPANWSATDATMLAELQHELLTTAEYQEPLKLPWGGLMWVHVMQVSNQVIRSKHSSQV